MLVVTALPANVPSPAGTILCDLDAPPLLNSTTQGLPFAVVLPADSELLGKTVVAQGASVDPALGALALTSALDVTIGSF